MRHKSDVDRMRDELAAGGTRVVVIGGYIGLEAAAVLRKLGCEVVLLEALDRVLARVAGEDIAHFFEDENRTKDYAQGRKLVENRAQIDPERLLDTERPLKDIAISSDGEAGR